MNKTSLEISGVEVPSNIVAFFCQRCFFSVFTILIFTLLSFTSLSAQSNEAESLELKVVTLEQQFDAQVLNVLSNYFDSRKFFVDINIDAQFVDATFRTTENQTIRNAQQDQQENVMMPGLPFTPEENIRAKEIQSNTGETTQTVINEHTVKRLQILGLRVNIYADSSFTTQEVEFMRLIGGIAAKVNEARGDVVNVTLINMPYFGVDELPPANDGLASDETILGSIKDYIPGFVLLMLVGLTLLVGRLTHSPSKKRSKRKSQQDPQHISREDLKESRPLNRNDSFSKGNMSGSNQESLQKKKPKPPTSDLSFVTDQFLNNSKEVALLFEFWMGEDQNLGAERAAKVVSTIDPHLLKALKHNLSIKSYAAIQKKTDTFGNITLKKKKEIVADFVTAMEREAQNSQKNTKHQQLGLFQFIDHLDDHHLVQLLVGEGLKSSALLIDYLPEQQAGRVLKRLGRERATEIMGAMAHLYELTYNQHKEISSQLFSKAMDILEVERELKQGSQNILRVLDKLPLEEQNAYIEQLKLIGSPVADVIAQKFITLEKIPQLSNNVVKEALNTISTDVLLDALPDLNDDIVEKLLSVRPKREQRLIRIELQQVDEFSEEKSSKAKAQIMNRIRAAVAAN